MLAINFLRRCFVLTILIARSSGFAPQPNYYQYKRVTDSIFRTSYEQQVLRTDLPQKQENQLRNNIKRSTLLAAQKHHNQQRQFNPLNDFLKCLLVGALTTNIAFYQCSPTWAQESTPMTISRRYSVVEEAWELINKYYIDRTFNGQDWKKVYDKYMDLTKKANYDDTKGMKYLIDMVGSLDDKYTRVLDVQQYAAIQKFDLIGVGVTLMPNAQKEIIVGAPPVEGSSSYKAGLLPGDYVTKVNGIPTAGQTAFDIIDEISEAPNAKTVTFTIRRVGENDLPTEGDIFDVTMERENFLQVKDPIKYKVSEIRKDGTKVGYVRISEFNSLVTAKLQDALNDLERQGVNAYVLDLRMNTGGAFQSAVEISSLFLEDSIATFVVDSNNVELPFKTSKGKLAIDKEDPMVVWIDGRSASATEVLAGSLHDNCRAVTMGEKSFGKGLIQAVYGLKNGAGLVMTVARYVTPSGTDIQGVGITPDIPGNVPPPPIIPGLSTDTSKVDFKDIAKRLDPAMCQLPDVDQATELAKKAADNVSNIK